jgi:hypothetical protein
LVASGTLTSRVDLAKKSAIRGIGRILGIDVGGSKTVHHQDHGSLGIRVVSSTCTSIALPRS